jgi:hypothetical protein
MQQKLTLPIRQGMSATVGRPVKKKTGSSFGVKVFSFSNRPSRRIQIRFAAPAHALAPIWPEDFNNFNYPQFIQDDTGRSRAVYKDLER